MSATSGGSEPVPTAGSTSSVAPGTVPQTEPYLGVETASTALGDVVVVRLESWPEASIVTVMLCGNDARRGTVDCDVAGSTVGEARPVAATFLRLPVHRPPVGCPCVLRAATQRTDVVRTVPIELPDVERLTPEQWEALTPVAQRSVATVAVAPGAAGVDVGPPLDPMPLLFLGGLLVALGVLVLALVRRPSARATADVAAIGRSPEDRDGAEPGDGPGSNGAGTSGDGGANRG